MSAPEHRRSRFHVARHREHPLEVSLQPPEGFAREQGRQRCPRPRHRGLDRVGERVVARGCGHAARLSERQLGVEQGHPEGRARIAAGHLLVSGRVGDERVRLGFAPRARGGRYADHGEQGARRLAVAAVVGHAAAVREQEVRALGAVERAAAAQRHEGIGAARPCRLGRHLHHRPIGLVVKVVKQRDLDPGRGESLARAPGMAARHEAAIGHEQCPTKAQLPGQFAQTAERTRAKDYAGARPPLEWLHAP